MFCKKQSSYVDLLSNKGVRFKALFPSCEAFVASKQDLGIMSGNTHMSHISLLML